MGAGREGACRGNRRSLVQLVESDGVGVLAEAAAAEEEGVFADEAVVVATDATGAGALPEGRPVLPTLPDPRVALPARLLNRDGVLHRTSEARSSWRSGAE